MSGIVRIFSFILCNSFCLMASLCHGVLRKAGRSGDKVRTIHLPETRSHRLSIICRAILLCAAVTMLTACPGKKESVSYSEAESGLRLAININEVAYNSWNKLYGDISARRRNGQISDEQWKNVTALDGVIVLSEADLIEGIERSKKLLSQWRNATQKVADAGTNAEITAWRNLETEAHRNFDSSIELLNLRSLKLRDTYAEAMDTVSGIVRNGNSLSADHIITIRQVIKMVDDEIARQRARGNDVAWRPYQPPPVPQSTNTRSRTVEKNGKSLQPLQPRR
jgi:hypothetical protein